MLARRVVLRQASQKAGARRRREAASAEVVRLAQKGEHGRAVALAASAGADRRAWRSVLSSLLSKGNYDITSSEFWSSDFTIENIWHTAPTIHGKSKVGGGDGGWWR